MITQIINILDSTIKAYKNVKKFVQEKYRIHRSKKIRNAVDKHDANTISRIVSDIIQRRQNKRDSNQTYTYADEPSQLCLLAGEGVYGGIAERGFVQMRNIVLIILILILSGCGYILDKNLGNELPKPYQLRFWIP